MSTIHVVFGDGGYVLEGAANYRSLLLASVGIPL
jgi:hypothetical protein